MYQEWRPPPPNPDPKAKQEEPQICPKCNGIGYYGRTAIFELMEVNDKIRECLIKNPNLDVLRQIVRQTGTRNIQDEGILLLEDAIRKMTSSVADRLSLRDRGMLREGMLADIIVFDPETVRDNATFTDPHRRSTGIRDVWVNGGRVLREGLHTGAMPGRIVDGPGRR